MDLDINDNDIIIEETSLNKDTKYIMRFITRSFLISVICFLIVLSIVFLVYCVDLFVNKKNGLNKSPLFNAYVIVSPSMVPTIEINDAVIVKREDEEYSIGDIITFLSADIKYKGLNITHRIVEKGQSSGNNVVYTTKGDNNPVSDSSTVSNDAIFGKVVLKIPKVGYVHNFLAKPSNFFLCVLIPTLVVIIYDILRISQTMKKNKEVI